MQFSDDLTLKFRAWRAARIQQARQDAAVARAERNEGDHRIKLLIRAIEVVEAGAAGSVDALIAQHRLRRRQSARGVFHLSTE